jgi:tetratricopeptide (TPR) repeat protein
MNSISGQGKSLQQILEERRGSGFVGRTTETLDFETNLKLSPEDPRRRFVFAIAGQGGMGKSALMSRCRSVASTHGCATAWSNEDDGDLVRVIERLAEDLASPHFEDLTKRIDEYRQVRHQLEADPEASESLARVMAGCAGRVATRLARHVPGAGIPLEFVDETAVGDALGDVAVFVLRHAKSRSDAELVLDPVERLTPMFVNALGLLTRERPVALFFDTYEETSHFLEPWLRRLLNAEYGALPSNFLCTIAGRFPLASEIWAPYESLIRQVELGPLSNDEAEEFLHQKGVVDPEMIARMIRLSHGLPILLVSMTIGVPKAVKSDTAVELVLRSVPDEYRSVALHGAVARTFDRDVAKQAIDHQDADQAFEWLLSMPFVQTASDGWRYHPVIREEFLEFAARESAADLISRHKKLAAFHKTEREKVGQENFGQFVVHAVEEAYHLIAAGVPDQVDRSNRLCLAMWEEAPGVTRYCAQAIRDGERDSIGVKGRGWGSSWIEAVDEYAKGHEQPSIEMLASLVQEGELSRDERVLALTIRSDLYFEQDRLDLALADIGSAIEIDESDARLHYERAWINLRYERLESAFMDAEQALMKVSKGDPIPLKFWETYVIAAAILFPPRDLLELLRSLDPGQREAWALRARGRALRELKDYRGAVSAFEQLAVVADGRVHMANEEIGETYREAEESSKAALHFERALKLDTECSKCWRGLQGAYAATMDKHEVEEALLSTCQDTDTPGTRAGRSVALFANDSGQLGFGEIEKAIEANPNQPDYRLWLARAHFATGETREALDSLEEALRLRPGWPKAVVLRGLCRYEFEDYEEAIEDWEYVTTSAPQEAEVVSPCDWGLCYSIVGRYELAVEQFDRDRSWNAIPELAYNRAVARSQLLGVMAVIDELRDADRVVQDAESQVVRHYGHGGIAALQGDVTLACSELELACDENAGSVLRWVANDPAWDDVRESSQFQRTIRQAAEKNRSAES